MNTESELNYTYEVEKLLSPASMISFISIALLFNASIAIIGAVITGIISIALGIWRMELGAKIVSTKANLIDNSMILATFTKKKPAPDIEEFFYKTQKETQIKLEANIKYINTAEARQTKLTICRYTFLILSGLFFIIAYAINII